MGHTTLDELRERRLASMTSAERAKHDETLAATRLATETGETNPQRESQPARRSRLCWSAVRRARRDATSACPSSHRSTNAQ